MALTRLAPSPTGALHLGNARTFLATWLHARQRGWDIALRIDDLDGPRIKPQAANEAIDDLRWLGLDWDSGPVYQSQNLERYRQAINLLIERGVTYPCVCTRREIERAASAPHAEDGAAIYPGTCRGKFASIEDAFKQTGRQPALRFAVPDMAFEFRDDFAGVQRFDLAKQIGDFVLAKPDGTPSYQLAVVVDDSAAGVTHVIRGDDLIDSVPRQALIYQSLGLENQLPSYIHLPLVLGSDGKRLAKRHGDTRLSHYRAAGVPADRMRALFGRWLGMNTDAGLSLEQALATFELSRVPREPIVFSSADDAFLMGANA